MSHHYVENYGRKIKSDYLTSFDYMEMDYTLFLSLCIRMSSSIRRVSLRASLLHCL